MTEDVCKLCGRKVWWAKMPSGKPNPFVKVTGYTIEDGENAVKAISDSPLFISHFVDCQRVGDLRKDHAAEVK